MKKLLLLLARPSILIFLGLILINSGFAQTTTTGSGNWSDAAKWSSGVPGNGTTTTVNHALTLDRNLSPTGNYTFNAPVTDPAGGANYNLTVDGGNANVNANVQVQGVLSLQGGLFNTATLTIRTGDTLFVGYPGSTATRTINGLSELYIEAGGVLLIYGNLNLEANGKIYCDGEILIDGNFHGETGYILFWETFPSEISGGGSISATGTITTDGSSEVFGSTGNCNSGPCSSGTPCGITQTLGANQTICPGSLPATITGNNLGGGVTYQWQKSTTSAFTGFSNINGATNRNQSFVGGVSVTTWYRRVVTVTATSCVANSSAVRVSMATPSPVSVGISASSTLFCVGTNVTFTATPANGGTTPTYQWQKNGSNISGATASTYSTTTLANGDAIRVVMTSNGTCISGNPATSNTITVTVNSPAAVSMVAEASSSAFCGATTDVTFTATPTNGGTTPTYRWKRTRGAATTNLSAVITSSTFTYTANDWQNGDIVFCEMTSNASCVTGSPATSNSITIHVTGTGNGNWTGITSSNWNTTSNWCSGNRPGAGTNVVIYGGALNEPRISTNTAQCFHLTLNSGAVLTVNNTLAVNGNSTISSGSIITTNSPMTIAGNLIVNSGASLEVTGSTTTITGNIVVNNGGSINLSGGVLTATGTVIVNNGGIVTINGGSLSANSNLTVNPGGILTIISPGTLSAKGTVLNNGTISGSGNMTLDGTGSQNISGTGTFGNITLNNGAGCVATTAITLSGYLTLASGQFTSNGNLTIDLNEGGIAGTGSGTILGDITVLKSILSKKYHYISSPFLNGINFTQWSDDASISLGQYKNLYYYNESIVDTARVVGWTPVSSVTDLIQPMKGYAMHFNSTAILDATGTYTHSATPSNISLSNSPSATTGSDGWHLVGNPYPSTLDWEEAGWTKTNVGEAIYFWDPTIERYDAYVGGIPVNNGSQYIPSMQAFWVKVSVSGGTGTLGMTNSVRTTTPSTFSLWRVAADQNILRLEVKNSQTPTDETVIRFREDASESFEYALDAFKKKNTGNTPSLYTKIGNEDYSINNLNNSLENRSIPLHLQAKLAGSYTIKAKDISNFDGAFDIMLEDLLLNESHDLRADPEYTFEVNPSDTTGRFLISFRKQIVAGNSGVADSKPSIAIRSNENTVHIKFENQSASKATIIVSNVQGQVKFIQENADISSGEYNVNLSEDESGIYIVNVTTQSQAQSGKVFLK